MESGYYQSSSSVHSDQFMFFIPVTVNLTYDFAFGHFHLLPKAGTGIAIVRFDDGEGSDASGTTFNLNFGAGGMWEIFKRHLYAGLWFDYCLIADSSAAWYGIMATASISYRF